MARHTVFATSLCLLCLALGAGLVLEAQSPAPPTPGLPFRLPPAAPVKTERPMAPPFELTTTDGQELRLVALEARGLLEPPLAFTELRLTFENSEARVREGRFRITLPVGAAVSRFAMKIDGAWQEAEVVERQKARRAYEDFLHRRQDPALLEQELGNQFSARVFPIPAGGRKELILSYSHELAAATDNYVIPLLGLPAIDQLEVQVLLGERPAAGGPSSNLGGSTSDRRVFALSKRGWKPDQDCEIPQDQVGQRAGLRHGNLAVVRVLPEIPAEPQKLPGLFLLIDTSASRALGKKRDLELAGDLIEALRAGSPQAEVGIAAFDQEVVEIFAGPASRFAAASLDPLRRRRSLGASDFGQALGWLAGRLAKTGGRYPRVVLLTDGMATAGETDRAALKKMVNELAAAGVERLDVLAAGGLRDPALLADLVRGNLAEDGAVIDAAAPLAEITRRLTLKCRSGIAVAVRGAEWVWPEQLDGMQPGDSALIYADLPPGEELQLSLDGRPVRPGTIALVERPLLERQWVAARIARLQQLAATRHAKDPDLRKALELQIVELSTRHRVMSPLTAFLVLESEADYQRYGLERRSLTDILTVGAGGLEVLARTAPPPLASAPPARQEPKQASQPSAVDRVTAVHDGRAGEAADAPATEPAGVPSIDDGPLRIAEESEALAAPAATDADASSFSVAGAAAEPMPAQRVPPPPPAPSPQRARIESSENFDIAAPAETVVESPRIEEERKTRPAGPVAEVLAMIAAGQVAAARERVDAWIGAEPGAVPALIALGEVYEAEGQLKAAARAYGSLIDLYPGRADLRRYAGERLERLGEGALALTIDTYRRAVADRPDHPSGHRLLAFALSRAGRHEEAFRALETALEQHYPGGRFAGVERILREDLGLLGAAWLRAEKTRREEVLARLAAHRSTLATAPSLRFVLSWETDANDVDLHVYDRHGDHAYFRNRTLKAGGELFADVTTGYGPECFAVPLPPESRTAPYRVAADYYSSGPMGFGMGLLQVVEHDGQGRLEVEARPFILMVEKAMVDLGKVESRLK